MQLGRKVTARQEVRELAPAINANAEASLAAINAFTQVFEQQNQRIFGLQQQLADMRAAQRCLPGPERVRELESEIQALIERLTGHRQRFADGITSRREIDAALVDAGHPEAAALRTNRRALADDLETLPNIIDELTQRETLAHLTYLQAVRTFAQEATQRFDTVLEPVRAEARAALKQLQDDDSGSGYVARLTVEDRTAVNGTLRALEAQA